MKVGGYENVPDWPKMGPSLLIATGLIVAIPTARWSATHDSTTSNIDHDREIDYAVSVTNRVFATLIKGVPVNLSPGEKCWYQATDEDQAK